MDPQIDEEAGRSDKKLQAIDPKSARFPFCLVWTPLPVISWLAPYIGHVGICRADGVILDFAGSYFVNVDNFTFGTTSRYVRLHVDSCLNRLAYQGSLQWNVIKVIGLIHLEGQWVDTSAAIKSFAPFAVVMLIGVLIAGWSFIIGWATFSFLLFAWFFVGTYVFRGLIEC